ncbi:MAG: hypothetical protein HKO95_00430 [Rhodobacteraceae bacterium]|nr:hypothetical protein [Paracoccaceae bacterium]
MRTKSLLLSVLPMAAGLAAAADPAVIEDARADWQGGSWQVSVTLSHGDTGWDDYADGWRVETEDGAILGTRTLFHPHVNEQPFTRSLGGVEIAEGVERVVIRARTNTEGWDGDPFILTLPQR